MTLPTQDKRIWLAGSAALAAVMITFGWLVLIGPQLSATSNLRGAATAARQQNSVLTTKVAKLKRQNDTIGRLRADLRSALAALPSDTGLPAFTRQLAAQATHNQVRLTSITVGSVTTTAGTATPSTAGTAGTATPSTAGTGAPGSTAPAPVPVAAAMVAIPITLLSNGNLQHQTAFLKAVQVTGPRRALVTSATLGAGAAAGSRGIDKSTVMTIQLTVFSAPLDAATRAQLAKLLKAK